MAREGFMHLRAAVIVALLLAAVPLAPRSAAASPELGARLLVRWNADATAEARDAAIRGIGATVDTDLAALGITRLALPAGEETDAAAAAELLSRDSAVARAEPDGLARLQFVPNDTLWLTDPYSGLGQWGARKALVDRAWDVARGNASVTVAVIDTGVDRDHPDLAGVLLPGATFVSAPSPGCGTGPNDDNSHGTHVAGIIGASGNNGLGISGVAFGVRILPIKALDCSGTGATSDIARSIIWATDQGAKIINISLGTTSDSFTLETAVKYAIDRNVLVVAAAGNCGSGGTRCVAPNVREYPGASPGVLAVGATATDDSITSFSTQGPQVAVSAPGLRIVSTTPQYATYQSARGSSTGYAAFSGTSQAAPFVAGIAALVWSADPTLKARDVFDRLVRTADDLGVPGRDDAYGAGRVNALRAVSPVGANLGFAATYDATAAPRSAVTGATFTANVKVTNTSLAQWSGIGANPVKLSYHWLDARGAVVTWEGARTAVTTGLVPPNASVTVPATVVAPAAPGTYTLRFDLVQEGVGWFSQRGVAPTDVAIVVGKGYGATYAPAAGSASLTTGNQGALAVTITNSGARTWPASGPNQVRLSYHWARADGSTLIWDGPRAPAFLADVLPGQSVTATLPLVPPAIGVYLLRVDLVQEGLAWFSAEGVPTRDIPFSITSGFAASYTPGAVPALLPGGRGLLPVQLRNDGTAAWTATGTNPVRLATHVFDMQGNVVRWDGERTPFTADVTPGTSVSALAVLDAPLLPGTYRVRLDLVREGVAWFSELGVRTAETTLVVLPDYRAQLPSGPLAVSRAAHTATLTLTNISGATWSSGGAVPIRVATHWYDAAGSVLLWDGPRTALPRTIVPGESVALTVELGVPPAGAAAVTIDLVADGLQWFGAGSRRPVTFAP
ncbi:MAG TPA: S8 family serine peptidase [Candidatus Limnocylindria bacterium]|nr:S8 family serine peptidase [Candidatus Limnocylindria bacterium]